MRLGLIACILSVEAQSSVPEPGIGTLKGDPVKKVLKDNTQLYSFSMNKLLKGLDRVVLYMDDILRSNMKEHDECLSKVLD